MDCPSACNRARSWIGRPERRRQDHDAPLSGGGDSGDPGTIRICGHDLAHAPLAAKQALAYFPDEPRLFDYLTVRQHLEFTARLYHIQDGEPHARQLLEELELTDKANQLRVNSRAA